MRTVHRLLGITALFLVTTGQASTEGCAPTPETAPGQETAPAVPSSPPGDTSQSADITTGPAPSAPGTAASPPLGRYTCLRLGITENQVAPDLALLPGGRYSTLDETGTYSFDPHSRTITWLSGSLATSKTNWVGIFIPAGQAGTSIESAKYPTITIRDKKDIAAGNKRDLQWCNHAG